MPRALAGGRPFCSPSRRRSRRTVTPCTAAGGSITITLATRSRAAYEQGWDLYPAQLPARYAAVYSFFMEAAEPAAARLRSFVEKAAQATLAGAVFSATGQGLLNFLLSAVAASALTEREAEAVTGLSSKELHGRSFAAIAAARR